MKNKALAYLERDYLLYVDMIECINRGIAELHYADGDGVLLSTGDVFMLAADDGEAAVRIMSTVDFEVLVVHDTAMLQTLLNAFGLTCKSACWQVAYTNREPLPESGTDIKPLTQEQAELVVRHYAMGDLDYIRERISAGEMYGAFEGDALMGFIGTHSEGAMGMLEVLPEYRRRGVALALEKNAINRALEKGYTPYAQLFLTNPESKALQEKLGMSFADKNIIWIWKPEE